MPTESRRRRRRREQFAWWPMFGLLLSALTIMLVLAVGPAHPAEAPPYWKCNGTAETNAAGCEEAYPSGAEAPKKQPLWEKYSCEALRSYLSTHTEDEARDEAKRLHLPRWLVRRAERCPR
jgi:hypothetical protein